MIVIVEVASIWMLVVLEMVAGDPSHSRFGLFDYIILFIAYE